MTALCRSLTQLPRTVTLPTTKRQLKAKSCERVRIIMIHQKVANWLPSQDLSSSAAMLSAPEGPREQEQMFVTATLTLKKPGQGKKEKKRTKNIQNMLKQVLDVFGLHTLKQCLNIRARQRNQATPRRPSFLATFLPNFLPNFLNLKLHFVALLSPLLTSVLQDPP